MSGDFEELVRGSMEWFTGDVRVPAGLAARWALRRTRPATERLSGPAPQPE